MRLMEEDIQIELSIIQRGQKLLEAKITPENFFHMWLMSHSGGHPCLSTDWPFLGFTTHPKLLLKKAMKLGSRSKREKS